MVLARDDGHHDVLANVDVHGLVVRVFSHFLHTLVGHVFTGPVHLNGILNSLTCRSIRGRTYVCALLKKAVLDSVVQVGGILPSSIRPPISNRDTFERHLEVGFEYRVRIIGYILPSVALAGNKCL